MYKKKVIFDLPALVFTEMLLKDWIKSHCVGCEGVCGKKCFKSVLERALVCLSKAEFIDDDDLKDSGNVEACPF